MNPTGSVTAFNTMIEVEFQIDLNFLKLMRLGPNVKNFITLGATERKSFIAKLLAEVESYIRDQKSASERSTLLNNTLKIATEKKRRLDIDDIETLHHTIDEKKNLLASYQKKKEDAIKEFFSYKGSIESSGFDTVLDDIQTIKDSIYDIEHKLKKLDKPKYFHIQTQDQLTEYNNQLSRLNKEKMNVVSHIAAMNTQYDYCNDDYTTLESELEKAKDISEEKELKEYIQMLE